MTAANRFSYNIADPITVTIASGETESSAADFGGCNLNAIIMPSAFDGENIYLKGSDDGVTYTDMYNTSGDRLSIVVSESAARRIGIVLSDFSSTRFIKIVASETQGADRAIIMVPRTGS